MSLPHNPSFNPIGLGPTMTNNDSGENRIMPHCELLLTNGYALCSAAGKHERPMMKLSTVTASKFAVLLGCRTCSSRKIGIDLTPQMSPLPSCPLPTNRPGQLCQGARPRGA